MKHSRSKRFSRIKNFANLSKKKVIKFSKKTYTKK